MTLDEAIKHAEDVAAKCFAERSSRNHSGKCGFEHLELAQWLKELKAYKEQEPCEDAISRAEVKKIAKEMYLEVANMELDVNTISDCISYTSSKCREVLERKMQALPSVTPKQKTGKWIELKDHKPEAYEDVLVRDIDGDVTCAYLCDDTDFLERFSGEIIDDVVEWMEIPG